MKNNKILLGYCVPYAFLAMYGDVQYGSMLLYALMIVCMGLLCRSCIKAKKLGVLLLGNVCSFAVCAVCILLFAGERWSWYFKPLLPYSMLLFVSVIALVLQLLIYQASAHKTPS